MKKLTSLAIAITIATTITGGVALATRNRLQQAEMTDALAILRNIIDLSTEVEVTVETHDFDGNGIVEIADALLVLRELVGVNDTQIPNQEKPAPVPPTSFAPMSIWFVDTFRGGDVADVDNFESVMLNKINTARLTGSTADRISEIAEFYKPIKIDRFVLICVEISEYGFIYYYAPADTGNFNHFSNSNGIEIVIERADTKYSATLEEIASANNFPITDGFAYSERGDVFAQVGDVVFRITAPPSLNSYDYLYSLARQVIDTAELVKVG